MVEEEQERESLHHSSPPRLVGLQILTTTSTLEGMPGGNAQLWLIVTQSPSHNNESERAAK